MRIEKTELSNKLKHFKNIITDKDLGSSVLFKNNQLMASDYSLSMTATLSTNTDESFVIPKNAIELIEKLPAGTLDITEKDENITIKSTNGRSRFKTFPANTLDFEVPEVENNLLFEIDSEKLLNAIKSVLYAVPVNPVKPVMGGVKVESNGTHLNIVACDGYRVAWNKIEYSGNLNVVIPRKTIEKLLSLNLSGNIALDGNKDIISRKDVHKWR